jgi:putative transposase
VAEIIRKLGISEQTFYRWKKRFAGLGIAELRRLRTLEEENSKLKQLVADQLVGGQRFRLLTLVDNHSRESLAIEVGQRLTGDDVVRVLEHVTAQRGKPQSIRVDNGPEFISKSLDLWACFNGVKLEFSRPGKPTDNAVIESFNGWLRDECLNQHWFLSLDEARAVTEAWREDYNRVRPHGALGNQTPSELAGPTTRLVSRRGQRHTQRFSLNVVTFKGGRRSQSGKENGHGPLADQDRLTGHAVLLKERAEVGGRVGMEKRNLRQGHLLEALVHQRLGRGVAIAVEHRREKEDRAGPLDRERLLAVHRHGQKMRAREPLWQRGRNVVAIGE